jgi:hypothetical protein
MGHACMRRARRLRSPAPARRPARTSGSRLAMCHVPHMRKYRSGARWPTRSSTAATGIIPPRLGAGLLVSHFTGGLVVSHKNTAQSKGIPTALRQHRAPAGQLGGPMAGSPWFNSSPCAGCLVCRVVGTCRPLCLRTASPPLVCCHCSGVLIWCAGGLLLALRRRVS